MALLRGLRTQASEGAFRLGDAPLTVLVGVTGVGKSTALQALTGAQILPDRREVTDAVMLEPLAGRAVTDREERFRLTAEYRQTHPGGMAQALGSLWADREVWGGHLIFDGLRGEHEVRYAAEHFPRWRFVALGAPDLVRVQRLLTRADEFDRVSQSATAESELRQALAALPEVGTVFSPADLDRLAALSGDAHAPSDILAKTKIVVSERRNYDPAAAEAFLQTLPPERALRLDTARLSPAEVAEAVRG